MGKTVPEASGGQVAKRERGSSPGAAHKTVSEPVSPAAGVKPVEYPIGPISVAVIVGGVSRTRRHTAIARVVVVAWGEAYPVVGPGTALAGEPRSTIGALLVTGDGCVASRVEPRSTTVAGMRSPDRDPATAALVSPEPATARTIPLITRTACAKRPRGSF